MSLESMLVMLEGVDGAGKSLSVPLSRCFLAVDANNTLPIKSLKLSFFLPPKPTPRSKEVVLPPSTLNDAVVRLCHGCSSEFRA